MHTVSNLYLQCGGGKKVGGKSREIVTASLFINIYVHRQRQPRLLRPLAHMRKPCTNNISEEPKKKPAPALNERQRNERQRRRRSES
jgi:hypothetical protein